MHEHDSTGASLSRRQFLWLAAAEFRELKRYSHAFVLCAIVVGSREGTDASLPPMC